MSDDIRNVSIQHGTDIISALVSDPLARVVGKEVVLQVPVFASGRAGHIYLSSEEYYQFTNSAFVTELIAWLDRNDVAAESRYEDKKEAAHE
jgi:hypothetical protein